MTLLHRIASAASLMSLSCAPRGSEMTTTPATKDASSAATTELRAPMPAGLYFRGYDTCGSCGQPTLAVVADVVETPEAASRLPSSSRLPPGYPLIVHTEELGVTGEGSGIAIVVGLFDDAEAANAWRVTHAPAGRVLSLMDDDAFWTREGRPRRVVHIAASEPVPAYPRDSVLRIESLLQDLEWQTSVAFDEALAERVAALEPACMLEPGSLQVWTQGIDPAATYYQWVPVQCGDTEAFVAWSATWLDSSVVSNPDGGHQVVQVVGAQCDSPMLAHWEWTTDGKLLATRSLDAYRSHC